MKRLFVVLAFLTLSLNVEAQTSAFKTITATAAKHDPSSWIKLTGTGISAHALTWNKVGVLSACSVKLEQSVDAITASDLGTAQDCTSNGGVTIPGTANYVRINPVTVTGAGSVVAVYNSTVGFTCAGGNCNLSGTIAAQKVANTATLLSVDATCATGNYWIAPIAGTVNSWRSCNNGVLGTPMTTVGGYTLAAANTVTGLPTGCMQYPCVVASKGWSGLTAAFNNTNCPTGTAAESAGIYTTNCNLYSVPATGFYLVTGGITVTTAGTSGTFTLNVGMYPGANLSTATGTADTSSGAQGSGNFTKSFNVFTRLIAGSDVSFSVAGASIVGSPAYALEISVTRIH